MTKREYFEKIKGIVANDAELVEFIDKQIELVSKKRTAPTAKQKENAELVEKIYDKMVSDGQPLAIADVMAMLECSNQKASALMKKLVDAKRVVKDKTEDGKKVIYKIA